MPRGVQGAGARVSEGSSWCAHEMLVSRVFRAAKIRLGRPVDACGAPATATNDRWRCRALGAFVILAEYVPGLEPA